MTEKELNRIETELRRCGYDKDDVTHWMPISSLPETNNEKNVSDFLNSK